MTGHPTVLIVDDNDLVRNLVVTLLKKSGFDVLSAASGQAAIDLVGRENPAIDCAVVDMSMPEVSGDQVVLSLRRSSPNTKVLLMSAYPEGQLASRVAAIGVDKYLQKPFNADDLLAALRALLQGTTGRKSEPD